MPVLRLACFLDAGHGRAEREALVSEHVYYVSPGETNLMALVPAGTERNRIVGHAMLLLGAEQGFRCIIATSLRRGSAESDDRVALANRLFETLVGTGSFTPEPA